VRDPTIQILGTLAAIGAGMWLVARFVRESAERLSEGMPPPRRNAVATALGAGAVLLTGAIVAIWIAMPRPGCDADQRPRFPWAFLALILAWLVACVARPLAQAHGARGLALVGRLGAGVLVALGFCGLILPAPPPARLESRAIGDLRSVLSGEEAFHTEMGAYADLECLKRPSGCVAGHAGPTFLDDPIGSPVRGGYAWAFHPGQPRSGAERWKLESYAITASPVHRHPGTCCAFCGDSTGRICHRRDGAPWMEPVGDCGSACQELEAHGHE
jgi:hypothetical protein